MSPQKSVGRYFQRAHKMIMESTVDVGVTLSTYLMHLLPLQKEPCLAGHESWRGWDRQGKEGYNSKEESCMARFKFQQLLN